MQMLQLLGYFRAAIHLRYFIFVLTYDCWKMHSSQNGKWFRSSRSSSEDYKMLVCDVCDKGYHFSCAKPQVNSAPKEGWKCEVRFTASTSFEIYSTQNISFLLVSFTGSIDVHLFLRLIYPSKCVMEQHRNFKYCVYVRWRIHFSMPQRLRKNEKKKKHTY